MDEFTIAHDQVHRIVMLCGSVLIPAAVVIVVHSIPILSHRFRQPHRSQRWGTNPLNVAA